MLAGLRVVTEQIFSKEDTFTADILTEQKTNKRNQIIYEISNKFSTLIILFYLSNAITVRWYFTDLFLTSKELNSWIRITGGKGSQRDVVFLCLTECALAYMDDRLDRMRVGMVRTIL